MYLNFYDNPDGSHRDAEMVFESPEEYQNWCKVMPSEMPDGDAMADPVHGVRKLETKYGKKIQPYIRIGIRKEGQTLEFKEGDRPIRAPAVKGMAPVPQSVKDASDENLAVMAARAGIKVTDQWSKRNRALRESDVTSAMQAKKEKEKEVAVA